MAGALGVVLRGQCLVVGTVGVLVWVWRRRVGRESERRVRMPRRIWAELALAMAMLTRWEVKVPRVRAAGEREASSSERLLPQRRSFLLNQAQVSGERPPKMLKHSALSTVRERDPLFSLLGSKKKEKNLIQLRSGVQLEFFENAML